MPISVDNLPASIRPVFTISELNKMQSECYGDIFETDRNVVVSAPTGSGKTLLFELAILRLHLKKQCEEAVQQLKKKTAWKVVYIGNNAAYYCSLSNGSSYQSVMR